MPIHIARGHKLSAFKRQLLYVFFDVLASIIAYTALFIYRRLYVDPDYFGMRATDLSFDQSYFKAIILLPIFWFCVYLLTGLYRDIFRRSRLREFIMLFNANLLGGLFVFFIIILDDYVADYRRYYQLFLMYFGWQFILTAVFRYILSSQTVERLQKRIIGFPTLMVGSNQKAVELYEKLIQKKRSHGNYFVGFVTVENNVNLLLDKNLPHLGNYLEMDKIIPSRSIEEVVIAVESSEHNKVQDILSRLDSHSVHIKLIPDTYDILSGKVKMESISEPLIEIPTDPMPYGQKIIKRILDILVSLTVLLLLTPVLLFCAMMVKLSSPGAVFYRQERLGYKGRPFDIIKFRSMQADAEKSGPKLSSKNDPRITKWGKFMRKYRFDELPQFWNVLIGEMSIVGPRPERAFFADQIIQIAPYYRQLYRIKPGITSWGMVKFGYAENVDEMVERLKYDLIYLENMNLLNDFKILLYTILIVFQGRGK